MNKKVIISLVKHEKEGMRCRCDHIHFSLCLYLGHQQSLWGNGLLCTDCTEPPAEGSRFIFQVKPLGPAAKVEENGL